MHDELPREPDEGESEPPRSADDLLPEVYEALRTLARARMAREAPGHTFQPTVLVHEAYLRLVAGEEGGAGSAEGWNGRGHFFGAAARAMRRILVEKARRRERLRHGGGRARVEVEEDELAIESPDGDVLGIDEALKRLEASDPRKGRVVELRYFAGLTVEETAAALDLSIGTVERDWRFAKAWLREELGEAGPAS